ncbi:N-acetylneuraminate synthase family protein [Neptuniibacter sp. QD29_5]|uniref:N-acetylneuraminate synthase family protein n=1 Tax=Neptuniibacter sp. QD29_5 TaxID=3398207 RepID=UPI0039F482EE
MLRDKQDRVYLIAEIGVNHDGSFERAKSLIDLAQASGANAVKFQSFSAKDLARHDTPKVEYQIETTGAETSHYEMLTSLELNAEEELGLLEYCNRIGIDFISTPYSVAAVESLDNMGVKQFKVASADIIDIPLLEAISVTGKPVILALGMASLGEIENALACFSNYHPSDVVLLHCVSNYPCSDESLNLQVIRTLQATFPHPVGFSDHSLGTLAGCVSVSLGAKVIEKHFTSDSTLPGPDHRASSEPDEFRELVNNVRRVELQLGSPWKQSQPEEAGMAKTSRKSLVYVRDIKAGEEFCREDFTMKRPGNGLGWDSVRYFIGQRAAKNCESNVNCMFSDIE